MQHGPSEFSRLQKIALSLMAVLVFVIFLGANLQAVLWQSSEWLVSTVLPAVVIDLTNEERQDHSVVPLQRNATLDAAATLKAQHMAKNEYFAHFSPTGISPWYWFDQSGYIFAHAGENLAIHFTDSEEMVKAWMLSPAHRDNIVSGKYTEIGVGTAKGQYEGYDTVYVVQLFATPAVVPVPKTVAHDSVPTLVSEPVREPTVLAVTAQERVVPVAESQLPEVLSEATKEVLEASVMAIEATSEPVVVVVTMLSVVESMYADGSLVLTTTAPLPDEKRVSLEFPIVATSSGLAVAQIFTPKRDHSAEIFAAVATKPNTLLQITYTILGLVVVALLATSIALEIRRTHYFQVAYGLLLLFVMSGLWFVHEWLTAGAVIV